MTLLMIVMAKATAVPPLLTTLLSWQELTGVLLQTDRKQSHAHTPPLSGHNRRIAAK